MRRYFTRLANIDCEPDAEDYLARTVFEPDSAPRATGLLDWIGQKLFAADERKPVGFITHKARS